MPGIPLACGLDEANDVLRRGEGQLPVRASMKVSINVTINALIQLRTVHHGTSDFGILFPDCIDRTTVDLKREILLFEWTDQSSELEFLVHVNLNIICEQ